MMSFEVDVERQVYAFRHGRASNVQEPAPRAYADSVDSKGTMPCLSLNFSRHA